VITNVAVGGAVWTRYTNVFRTGGPDDPRVGGDLNLQIFMQKLPPQYGTATATFTNLQLQVSTTRPVLSILQTPEGNVQLRWATNFDWYIPQITIDLQAGVWTALTNQPFTAENQLVLEVGQDTGPHFFRLCQP
jgi:hypothetical protein